MLLLILVCGLCGLGLADDALNKEVDGWLSDWYSSRLLTKTGLDPLEISWTEGSLWWEKARTLSCLGGLVDLTGGKVSRLGDAQSRLMPNSSRPWVAVDLGLAEKGRFVYYNCSLDGNNSTVGLVSGNLSTPSTGGIDLLFTYRSKAWWCNVHTISLEFSLGGLVFEEFLLDGIPEVPKGAQEDLQVTVLAEVTKAIEGTWNVVGDGPKCDDKHCKTSKDKKVRAEY